MSRGGNPQTRSQVLVEYQKHFARWFGVERAFAFWKGRAALFAILKALGVGQGDEVVLPGYTCVVAVNPIKYLGAKPVYIDIEPNTYNMDPALIEDRLTAKTKLIIVQHTYGYPASMGAILEIANRKGLPVVEDCCHALGSEYENRKVGTFGTAAYFSFQWNKPYTSGLGGMAITNDRDLATRIDEICEQELQPPDRLQVTMLAVQLATYRALVYPETTPLIQRAFRWMSAKGLAIGSSGEVDFGPTMSEGFFVGMSEFQARVGIRELRNAEPNIAHRRKTARIYDELLRQREWPLHKIPPNTNPVLVTYPVRVANKDLALIASIKRLIELGSWFECPLHPITTVMANYDYQTGMCPTAELASRQVVNLPTHPRVSARTAKRSVQFISRMGPPRSN